MTLSYLGDPAEFDFFVANKPQSLLFFLEFPKPLECFLKLTVKVGAENIRNLYYAWGRLGLVSYSCWQRSTVQLYQIKANRLCTQCMVLTT